jgi:hypothetical protein
VEQHEASFFEWPTLTGDPTPLGIVGPAPPRTVVRDEGRRIGARAKAQIAAQIIFLTHRALRVLT